METYSHTHLALTTVKHHQTELVLKHSIAVSEIVLLCT